MLSRFLIGCKLQDIISWNIVFSGLSQGDDAREIGRFFHKLMLTGLNPNLCDFLNLV